MKRYFVCLSLIILLAFSSGCLSEPSVELINSSVDIVNDRNKTGTINITEGDKKGQQLVPTALYYEFTIKNAGNISIGSMEEKKGLYLKIVPNTELEAISNEVIGFNIFNQSSYADSGLGHGSTLTPMLKNGEEGKFALHYELGVTDENPEVPLRVPPAEELKKLKNEAFDATLILMSGDNEIARFDLNKER